MNQDITLNKIKINEILSAGLKAAFFIFLISLSCQSLGSINQPHLPRELDTITAGSGSSSSVEGTSGVQSTSGLEEWSQGQNVITVSSLSEKLLESLTSSHLAALDLIRSLGIQPLLNNDRNRLKAEEVNTSVVQNAVTTYSHQESSGIKLYRFDLHQMGNSSNYQEQPVENEATAQVELADFDPHFMGNSS